MPPTPFSQDYATARTRFLDAARQVGAPVESIAATPEGPLGEPLFMDVATVGSALAEHVVIVSSGLHGVEGFLGSAVQLAWLTRAVGEAPPPGVRIVLAHALNPFGFAWLRRVSEHNVDLNRNFLTDRSVLSGEPFRQHQAVYDRLEPFLNPYTPPSRWEPYLLKVAGLAVTEGLGALQRTLPVGQYTHEGGLFYGGREAEDATTMLRGELVRWIDSARLAIHLDLHTGLGRWAECQLLIADPGNSERAQWAAARFGPQVCASDDRVAYRAHGTMAADFRERARPCSYHCLTAEFGTYSGVRVLGALRAENRAHHYSAPDSPAYARAKCRLLETFTPRSTAWRHATVAQGLALVDRAASVCRSV